MAYKELEKKIYREIGVWALKDRLSARQTAINVAGSFLAASVERGDEVSEEDIIKLADKVFKWLFQDIEGSTYSKITGLAAKRGAKEAKEDKVTELPF